MNSKLLLCLALVLSGLTGCCSAPSSLRSRMSQAAIAALPKSVQQTKFAYIGDIQTDKGVYHVAEQKLILADMPAPRGLPVHLLIFSNKARLVATYEADIGNGLDVYPLWCAGSRIYFYGFGSFHFADSVNHEVPPSPRLARLFAGTNRTPTGNVIDFSRGPLKPFLTRAKRYGSSGGLEDNPWKLP